MIFFNSGYDKQSYDIVKVLNTNNQFYWISPNINILIYSTSLIVPTYIYSLPFSLKKYEGMCIYNDFNIHHLICSISKSLYYLRIDSINYTMLSNPRIIGTGSYPKLFLRKENILFQYKFCILYLDIANQWKLLLTNNFLTFFLRSDINEFDNYFTFENTNLKISQYIQMQQLNTYTLKSDKSFLEAQCA